MWPALFSLEASRRRALKKAPPGPMRDFLDAPLQDRNRGCDQSRIVSLDLETTGLDPKRHSILSIGLVEIERMSVRLDTSWHQLIQPEHLIPEESAVIHQITDDQAAEGIPLSEALPQLLQRLAGKVMLVHFARIEQQFIDAACRQLYGAPFLVPTIDTLVLGQRYLSLRNHSIQTGDLRLFNLRPRFNLPRYKAHNALSDALATAELFLAMAAEMAPGRECRLERFLTN